MTTTTTKRLLATVTAAAGSTGEAEMTISTATPDRDHDRILPGGGDFAAFKRNPVLLWGHDHSALPIGTVTALDVRGDAIRAKWRWLEDDDFAERVRNAWEQGIVRAASIGFLPRESTLNEFGGRDYVAWELAEVSLVPVPANSQAVRALKHLNLWNRDDAVLELEEEILELTAPLLLDVGVDPAQIRAMARPIITEHVRALVAAEAERQQGDRLPIEPDEVRAALRAATGEAIRALVCEEISKRRGRLV